MHDWRSAAPLSVALPPQLAVSIPWRLVATGLAVPVGPWQSAGSKGGILLLAAHELSQGERDEVLDSANWAWVHLTSAGADFIDLARWPRDRLLTRSWQCYAAPLAEYAITAIATHEWRNGARWEAPAATGQAGLWRARIAIAGWGAVGQRIATVAAALGATVQVLSRTPRPPNGPISHTTDIEDLLDADHLVVALPLTPQTRLLFDRHILAGARPGLHLVNLSRAEIVDQDALYALCRQGHLAATLDVSDPEPLPAGHPLRSLPSVRYSPHLAWRSRESEYAFIEDLADIWSALARGTVNVPGTVGDSRPERARAAVAGRDPRGASQSPTDRRTARQASRATAPTTGQGAGR